jgi:hypothetical protein
MSFHSVERVTHGPVGAAVRGILDPALVPTAQRKKF